MKYKSIILFDCDQVLCNFMEPAIALIEQHVGEPYQGELSSSLRDMYHPTHLEKLQLEHFDQPGFVEHKLQPFDEAMEGMEKIRSLDYEVYCVTSCIETCPTWTFERMRWLNKHFGIDKKHTLIAADKHLVYGDVFVDDLPKNLDPWAERWHSSQAVMLESKFNKNEPCSYPVKRVQTWDQIYDVCVKQMEKRK